MLHKDAKKVLKQLKSFQREESEIITFWGSPFRLVDPKNGKSEPGIFPERKYFEILDALEAEGLIRRPAPSSCAVTHRGNHQLFYSKEEAKNYIFRSVLTPVFVSIVTTVLTEWLIHRFFS